MSDLTIASPTPSPVTAPAPVEAQAPVAPVNPVADPIKQEDTPDAPAPAPEPAPVPGSLKLDAPEPAPVYKHEATGNAAYDLAMSVFAAKGFSPDHEAFLPASNGDFTLLEKFVKDNGIDSTYLDLAKQAHQQITAHQKEVHGKTIEEVMTLVGGTDRWQKVTDWVKQTADPKELEEWSAELEAGGKRSVAAAKYLSDLFAQHGENVVTGKPSTPFNPDASSGASSNSAPLSPAEFKAEQSKLIEKIGYSRLEDSEEYKALQQRRLAWRG